MRVSAGESHAESKKSGVQSRNRLAGIAVQLLLLKVIECVSTTNLVTYENNLHPS